jgi:hypothetical protein
MMMKKLLTILLATTISLSSAVTAFAATSDDNLATDSKYVASEKSDKNTLYHYKQQSEQYSKAYIAYLDKQVKSITAGITDDYDKAKAINKYVAENLWYDWDGTATGSSNYFNPADTGGRGDGGVELIAGDRTVCLGFTTYASGLLRAAGIPAKEITGYLNSQNHAWIEAYVDGKWVFMDPTLCSRNSYYKGKFSEQRPSDGHYFDLPLDKWSLDHRVNTEWLKDAGDDDSSAWDGKLLFYSADNGRINGLAKEVSTNLNAGDKLASTYGFNAKDLYKDYACTEHWDLDTDVVDESHYVIYVKDYKPNNYTIYFDSCGGTAVNPVSVSAESEHTWVTIDAPTNPTRDGYDFVGWYPNYQYYEGAKMVDFTTYKVTNGDKFRAIWRDKSTGAIVAPDATTSTDTTTTTTNTATTATTTATTKITGWSKAYGVWRYYDSAGNMKLGWLNDNGTWYYLEGDGRMKTGWLYDRGHWYYLTDSGAMAHDTTIGRYTLGSDGANIN